VLFRSRKAGDKTDEITGRTITLNYATGEPILTSRSANIRQRVNAVRGFNSGETDVIILNQAGSTGLSLHASNKVKDQRKRHMLIVQPEKNIDTHMQMLGRVHRTGQVVTPSYSQMMSDIPA
jgi:thymidylate synthase